MKNKIISLIEKQKISSKDIRFYLLVVEAFPNGIIDESVRGIAKKFSGYKKSSVWLHLQKLIQNGLLEKEVMNERHCIYRIKNEKIWR